MIDDGTPNRVFKISELARAIASQLVLIDQQSAVNLACTCQDLEESALSALWETQRLLDKLLEVLPEETWDYGDPESGKFVVCDLDFPFEKSND